MGNCRVTPDHFGRVQASLQDDLFLFFPLKANRGQDKLIKLFHLGGSAQIFRTKPPNAPSRPVICRTRQTRHLPLTISLDYGWEAPAGKWWLHGKQERGTEIRGKAAGDGRVGRQRFLQIQPPTQAPITRVPLYFAAVNPAF